MSRHEKLLAKLLSGQSDNNFNFTDLVTVLTHIGYRHVRTAGSHQIFKHTTLPMINLQPRPDGKAKSYQIRQVREFLKNK